MLDALELELENLKRLVGLAKSLVGHRTEMDFRPLSSVWKWVGVLES